MKGFLHGTPSYTDFPLSEEEQRNYSSTSSISPMEEDTLLSYPSSQSSYLMISPNQPPPQMHGSNFLEYFPAPQDYGSGSDSGHHSLMYPSTQVNSHPFMTSGSNYSSTSLSPTSSISSGTLHNFTSAAAVTATAPNLYLQVSNGGMSYEMEDSMHKESGSSNSNSDGSNGLLPEYHTATRPYKISSSESCASGSNEVRERTAPMAPHPTRGGNRYNNHNNSNKEHRFAPSRDCVHGKKIPYPKGQARDKPKKRCSNCRSVQSPSWRRSILKTSKGDLLCNACGLYEKTAHRKRMLVTHDGNTKVVRKRETRDFCCSSCGSKDATRWKRVHDSIQCERCARHHRISA